MDEPRLTPGPWEVAKQPYSLVIRGSDGHIVATAYGWNEDGKPGHEESKAQANAALIAAAPELYEVLKEVFGQLEYHEPIWYTGGMYRQIKAALEKAERKGGEEVGNR